MENTEKQSYMGDTDMNMFTNPYDDQNFASRLSDGAFLMIGLGGEGIRALKALKLQMLNFR